ncbi:MAG: hypothetical protein N7Q72_03970, partial [Spiroplasma sp. Tabriz.8]|nr:hypothetical protein [Spiroplasma sp. Tabriz.8]
RRSCDITINENINFFLKIIFFSIFSLPPVFVFFYIYIYIYISKYFHLPIYLFTFLTFFYF